MKLTIEAAGLSELMAEVDIFLADMGFERALIAPKDSPSPDPEPKPKKKPKKKKPEPAPDAGPEPEPEPAPELEIPADDTPEQTVVDAKKEAMSLLVVLYNEGGEAKAAVKGLLDEYGVNKFSEIAEDQGPGLLGAAMRLKDAHGG